MSTEDSPAGQGVQVADVMAALPGTGLLDPNGLPQVLTPEDAQRYKRIFALQTGGKWKSADKEIAKLQDRRLMGHVLYQRFMHPRAYRSKYRELKMWLDNYADHPNARQVYRLALKRRPKNYRYPRRPTTPRGSLSAPLRVQGTSEYSSPRRRSAATGRKVRRIQRIVRRNVMRARLTPTQRLLEQKSTRRLLADYLEQNPRYASAYQLLEYGKAEPSLPGYEAVRRLISSTVVRVVQGAEVESSLTRLQQEAQATLHDY